MPKDKKLVNGYIRSNYKLKNIPTAIIQLFIAYYVILEKWNTEIKGECVVIDNEDSVFTTKKALYQTAFGTADIIKGKHHWKIKIEKLVKTQSWSAWWRFMIGIIDKNVMNGVINRYFTHSKGYAFIASAYSNTPFIATNSSSIGKYGKEIKTNDIIDMYVDMDKKQ